MSTDDIKQVLDFWFCKCAQDTPQIDGRMSRWLDPDPEMDEEIKQTFGELIKQASKDGLQDWEASAEGRLALILLLDQFSRRIHPGRTVVYRGDQRALKLCADGVESGLFRELSPEQRIFFFMPLQHAESLKIQQTSVRIYNSLVEKVSETMKETFRTFAQFAELHHDIIAEFGRFPHRNKLLGRKNTVAEKTYLAVETALSSQ
ncbi:MAG: DUF924 domain-containing protein [Gammaproteobacteria bacterium]|jgi:uncharacterized protein (DUF924 family)|nr:DUF924 domain-containing protein [Gammaproteobacteria bacterium]